MAGTNYSNKKHRTYGGEITLEDFNTTLPNKKRISNQITADNLQSLEKKKVKNNEERKYKNMTLEELREMKIVSNSNGRPSSILTDEKWQKEFNVRKLFNQAYSKDVKKFGGKNSKESGVWNKETKGDYHGCTNWQQYCGFINDVLSNIRSGQIDYCYYIFQIMDLAKFSFGKEQLRTKYRDGYWEVWLENM